MICLRILLLLCLVLLTTQTALAQELGPPKRPPSGYNDPGPGNPSEVILGTWISRGEPGLRAMQVNTDEVIDPANPTKSPVDLDGEQGLPLWPGDLQITFKVDGTFTTFQRKETGNWDITNIRKSFSYRDENNIECSVYEADLVLNGEGYSFLWSAQDILTVGRNYPKWGWSKSLYRMK